MSLTRCIPKGFGARGKSLQEAAKKWEQHFGGEKDAQARAEVAAINEKLRLIEKRKQQIILNANAETAGRLRIDKAGTLRGRAINAILEKDPLGMGLDKASAAQAGHVTEAAARHHAAPLLELAEATAKLPRAEQQAVSDDLLRAVAGQKVERKGVNEAAAAWRDKAAPWLRSQFNALGGDIKTLGSWLMPQAWTSEKIFPKGADIAAARDAFVSFMSDHYESGKIAPIMGDDGAPLLPTEARALFGNMADDIRNGETPSSSIGRRSGGMKGRHRDPRVINFTDVEARIDAMHRFGNPNSFEVIDGHIRALSREIGVMKRLGANPDQTFANLVEYAKKGGGYGNSLIPEDQAWSQLDATYQSVTGSLWNPASPSIAGFYGSIKAGLSAGMLPMSVISQAGDLAPISMTSSLWGMPAMKAIKLGLTQLVGGGMTRSELTRLGVVVDGMLSHLSNSGVLESGGKSKWLSEATQRFYGTKRWAETMEAGSQMGVLGHLAELRGRAFPEADAAMNGVLSEHGWTAAKWDALRQHVIETVRGTDWASVGAIHASELGAKEKDDLAAQILYTMRTFSNQTMTVPDARIRAGMVFGQQAGTHGAGVAGLATQFKSFGTQFVVNQVGQIMRLPTASARVGYAAKMIAATSALGMVSLQVKRLLKGQGLADMEKPGVLVSAGLQGGGFGIIGDIVNSATAESRFGHGLVSTIAGPAFGTAEDLVGLTLGNAGQLARGEKANVGSEAIKMVGRYTPFVNAPFIGLAWQRGVVDQARLWADPSGTRRSFMTMAQQQRQDYNAQDWWRHGSLTPGQ